MRHLSDQQTRLLQKHILDIRGTIDEETADYVRNALTELAAAGTPPIKILITSSGGDVDIGLHIYDGVACYRNTVEGIVIGFARSMAAIILQGCDVRMCLPHSKILIHHVSQRQVKLDDMRDETKRMDILAKTEVNQNYLYKILAERTGKTIEVIRCECEKDRNMTAEEALEFGLIDEIVPTRKFIRREVEKK
ncbi:MAG: hypothetical protein A2836_01520 [Candidatus Taylorbacteria bacterium RIFCSPHIGHO2_01_FULL_45_63]|uniref:ATP-dependent Clp protease proteolytic subunit n=1 Tax=Candidatus Taylorbacteria bacterium RIFCSPHIGHO2_02_FULL_45_35 TaxID=1802311 RepID=A0A1G2MW36_9BACT|nr:MAG: hypothetical protein A2836_01520 [Candidatus Taylorbacteria bacterium RIFCSPHIGHO2_01_FULL_45_63]OHA28088.1 MAG: hypothetical protein A3D56_00220 [Candidatus Taylorbacteria bacterium RIFCSPHIGHO2_02_FULL_45_35]OHA34915.1 MAG: hypothetical protein A3A22_03020 [Candidatus Taylorbacteria bacterium RIFCSPLOWO2_01_FULL_45_34b]